MAFTRDKQKLSHCGIVCHNAAFFSSHYKKKRRGGGGSFCHILPGLPQISVLMRLAFFKGNVNYVSNIVHQKMNFEIILLNTLEIICVFK